MATVETEMAELPLYTVFGDTTPFVMELIHEANDVTVRIDVGFAGRDVEESISYEDLAKIAGDEPFVFQEVLGLIFTTDGETITGKVSVGSGNERFTLKKADLLAALSEAK